MSEITVKDLKLLCKALERDIEDRIATFEDITGIAVTRVHVSRFDVPDMDSPSRKSVLAGIEISTSL